MGLLHILKGVPGFGLQCHAIDVSRIALISTRKRLFKLDDRDKEYVLSIDYFRSDKARSPVILTRRFRSIQEIEDEINEINRKIEYSSCKFQK